MNDNASISHSAVPITNSGLDNAENINDDNIQEVQLPDVHDAMSDCQFDEPEEVENKIWEATPTPGYLEQPKTSSPAGKKSEQESAWAPN